MDLQRLAEPFAPEDVEWRIQRNGISNGKPWAMVLAYITNRAIMDRLDEVCGVEWWKNEFKEWHETSQLCGISIWDSDKGEWVTKWDGADATNIEATKGGLSDSMKRAGVQWGIGRYLYKLDATFVDLIEGRSKDKGCINVFVDKKNMHFKIPALPAFAIPNNKVPEATVLEEFNKNVKKAFTSPRKETAVDELTKMKSEILAKYKESDRDPAKFKDFLLETCGVDELKRIEDAQEVLDELNK